MPVEMVWNDLKYFLTSEVKCHKRSINKGHKKILGIEDERFGLLQQQI
jgi:hypothetical protein